MKQVIPVVVINDEKETIEILSKLREGGINCAEITFRTACAKEAIAIGTKAFEDMNIGAGTVINAEQAKSAVQAGAKFIVSPGFSDEVARYCTDEKIPYYPGCVTPTEIMRALSSGLNVVKFFPAGRYVGLKAIKEFSAQVQQLIFIPPGGVDMSAWNEHLDVDKL